MCMGTLGRERVGEIGIEIKRENVSQENPRTLLHTIGVIKLYLGNVTRTTQMNTATTTA